MNRPYDVHEIVTTRATAVEAIAVAAAVQEQHGGRVQVYRLTGRLLRRRVLVTELRPGGAR